MERPPRPELALLRSSRPSACPCCRLVYRLRDSGREHVPDGGCVLAANHWSNFDPWPLGIPLFPRRFLRFMAKKELFWPPLGWIVAAGGGFRVDRGTRDQQAIDTAVELCRAGHAVVMFPEGTRRAKGLVKRHEARWHTGAARIALAAGVPLVPAGIGGHRPSRPARPAARRLRRADRRGRPRATRRGRGGRDRHRPPARRDHRARALRRLDAARGGRVSAPAPRRRRRLVRASRVPRAAALDPPGERSAREPPHGAHLDDAPALAGRAAARRVRRLGHADRARPTGTRRSPATRPAESSTPSCSSSSTSRRACSRRPGSPAARAPASRPTTSSPPRWPRSEPPAGPRSWRPPTVTRSSSQPTT